MENKNVHVFAVKKECLIFEKEILESMVAEFITCIGIVFLARCMVTAAVVMVAFPSLTGIWGDRMFDHSFPACPFFHSFIKWRLAHAH